jgi:hypothetical protein
MRANEIKKKNNNQVILLHFFDGTQGLQTVGSKNYDSALEISFCMAPQFIYVQQAGHGGYCTEGSDTRDLIVAQKECE